MDVSDFYDTFFEEAGELLEDMERLLIELDTDAPDRDHLDAIFRAAHSIKGGAGTFGFEALQDTTHRMENLLDRARNGELTLDRAAVDILLEAGDVLKGQVESYREGQSPDAEAADRICRVLQQLAEGASPSPISAEPGTGAPADSAPVDTGERCLSIRVTGIGAGDADALAEELALFGAVTDRHDEPEALTLELTTSAATADISAVLCFIVDEDQIRIEPAGPAQAAGDGARLRVILDGVTPEDRPALVEEVGLFGEIVAQHADGERLSLDLVSDQPAEDIAAVLAFQLDADQIHVESLTADAPAAAESKPEASPDEGPSTDKTDQTAAGVSPSKPAPSKPAPAAQAASGERPRERSGSESTSVRVPTDKIDQIINLVGELVITQSMLERAVGELDREHGEGLSEGMGQLARNARDLQESVMSVRMVPMDFAFNRFPRLVRDLSAKLGKDVNLETRGGATELDKGLIERIMDPMTHLVRNSLDHGIEDAATREAAGKPAAGQLTLSARHQGGNVVIEIGDDGAGLSRERILAKARSNGLAVSDDMPDEEVWQLIFAAGFSTAEQVSDVSGRGVGMDVVKRNIAQLGGHVDLRSQQGVGTTVRVILPLTLAIMDGMAVRVGDEVFILALGAILESMRIDESAVRTVTAGHHVIEVRGEYLPLVALHRAFDVEGAQTRLDRGIVVVVSSESRRFGLFVDELIGEQQVVVKNLETHFRKVAGISAATILGDGSVALILDATALSRMAGAPRPARSSSQSPADNNVPAESVSHE